MPTYEYRCENGHTFEVIQSMSADPVEACQECGAPVERVFHPVAVHFKGSGFYSTDYAEKSKDGAAKEGSSKDGDSKSSSESKDSGSASGSSDAKGEKKAKAGSGSDSD
jgi:putative FmdB family regulatory protein